MVTCGGAAQIQLRASAPEAVKALIPRKMETPKVVMRMGAEHEDRLITEDLRTCFGRRCLFLATVKRVYLN